MKLTEVKDTGPLCFLLEVEGFHLYMLAEAGSGEAKLLQEAKLKGTPLGGPYSALYHAAHVPNTQDHLHVFCKQNQLFAINRDGTAHDRSHQTKIPERVAAAIKEKFPGFTLPPNNFIESAPPEVQSIYSTILFG